MSYRTDKMLNEKIQNLNNSRNQIHEKDDPTDMINSTNKQPSINEEYKNIQTLNCKSGRVLQKLEIDFHQNSSYRDDQVVETLDTFHASGREWSRNRADAG